MQSLRCAVGIVLLSLSVAITAACAQPQSGDAQRSYETMKALAGNWVGTVATDPPMRAMGDGAHMQVSLRVTSRGNAVVHEMHEAGKPDDPTRYEHPVTVFYLAGDSLLMTHYCDTGNRPRMVCRASPNGKIVAFELLDIAGSTQHGYMNRAVFTLVDENHHMEDWCTVMPGNKALCAHFALRRASTSAR